MPTRPPGTLVTTTTRRPSHGIPTNTGVAFATAQLDWGPVGTAIPAKSIDDVVTATGDRVPYGLGYDFADIAFREGLPSVYFSRVVGPAAAKSTHTFVDRAGTPLSTVSVTAKYPGDKGNTLSITFEAGQDSGTVILVVLLNGEIVDASAEASTPADLAAFNSVWVDVADLHSATTAPNNLPALVTGVALSGGTDDRTNITETQWTNALAAFPVTLGPGQVCAPGRTTDAAHLALVTHAQANNRFAVLDFEDSADIAEAISSAAAVKAAVDGGYSCAFIPWQTYPGVLSGVTADTRTLPPSALIAGLCGRVDALDDSAGTAPAGHNGQSAYALDVTQTYTDDDRGTVNLAGVDVIRNPYGTVMNYGIRSLDTTGYWTEFTLGRVRMAITAQAEALGEAFIFDKINNQTLIAWNNALRGMLTRMWNDGSLYGDTADESFAVDVGPTVNTPDSVAAGHLKATLSVRLTESAEFVDINVVKVPIQEAV